ncbi:nitroreductase family protein [Chloroflexota bacterium]
MIRDLILENRSCRRFYQDFVIEKETLRELVDLARCSASTSNRQPLKYMIFCEPDKNDLIFPLIFLARRFPEQRYPPEGERPTAYIIVLGDKEITEAFAPDHGIAAQNILLGAREKGLGGCMVMMIKREELTEILQIPPQYRVLMVIAIGKPKEEVTLENIGQDGEYKFYWDDNGLLHVPKRSLDEIIVASYAP